MNEAIDEGESEVKLVRMLRVKNDLGLHTRPATQIVKLLSGRKSQVTFTHKGETVRADSILNLLMLAAQKHAQILVTAIGEDAQQTLDDLTEIFETQFGEDG